MIRYLGVALAFLTLPWLSWADTVKSETEAKQLTGKIMAQVAKGDVSGAFASMKPYVVNPDAEFQGLALQTISQREQLGARYGKSIGYELVSENKAGESILRLIYMEKTSKHVLPWVFYFYKLPTGWVLHSFAWSDQIQNAFHP